MKAIAVSTTHKAVDLAREDPDLILPDFLGFDAERLKQVFA